MAQLLITLLFTGLLALTARAILHDLTRPLVNRPACWDDAVYDALCDGLGAPERVATPRPTSVMARRSSLRPTQGHVLPRPSLHRPLAAAA